MINTSMDMWKRHKDQTMHAIAMRTCRNRAEWGVGVRRRQHLISVKFGPLVHLLIHAWMERSAQCSLFFSSSSLHLQAISHQLSESPDSPPSVLPPMSPLHTFYSLLTDSLLTFTHTDGLVLFLLFLQTQTETEPAKRTGTVVILSDIKCCGAVWILVPNWPYFLNSLQRNREIWKKE
ncbi:hypothetical protein ACH5RR_036441 [Cinchona calisaya]|uniref:Uncharacterized protein n=1 Tax=Cinchona calisaya TaxID=153742 RepID=A0ABD2Y7Z1_9GENT